MKIRGYTFQLCALAVLAIFLFSACGKTRYPIKYILDYPQASARGKTPKQLPGTVLVREFRCSEYLCRGPIVFRPGPEEVGYYEYHRWAMNPRLPITHLTVEVLRAQSLFDCVAPYEKGTEPDFVFSGQIERFNEIDRGRDVAVECSISAALTDTRTGSVIWSDRASETLPVSERNVRGVVRALTQASQIAIDKLVQSMMNKLAPVP
jgi:ABC-type uncharacterized transport system auxiliary subunit